MPGQASFGGGRIQAQTRRLAVIRRASRRGVVVRGATWIRDRRAVSPRQEGENATEIRLRWRKLTASRERCYIDPDTRRPTSSSVPGGYRMKKTIAALVLAATLPFSQNLAFAHHGQAGYNNTAPVTVKGKVTDFLFSNPHCIVSFDVKGDHGDVQKWQGELTSPNHLIRAGWNAHTLKPGDDVTITGWRAKSGANSLWITKTIVNGEELKTAPED